MPANLVFREPLDFHHIRRPFQNQTEVVGPTHRRRHAQPAVRIRIPPRQVPHRGHGGRRSRLHLRLLVSDDRADGHPTMRETQPAPLDMDTVARTTFVNDRTHAFYVQDQIDITPQVKVNSAIAWTTTSAPSTRVGGLPFTPQCGGSRPRTRTGRASSMRRAPTSRSISRRRRRSRPSIRCPRDGVAARAEHGPQLRSRPPLAGMERSRRHHRRLLLRRPQQRNVQQSPSLHSDRRADSKGLDVDVNTDLGG